MVAIPGSVLSEVHHLRDKTHKAGVIGRACAVFRVDEVVVYVDRPGVEGDARLLATLLDYMSCPQYLRRLLFPIRPALKYVGVLPPLRTPNHPTESKASRLPSVSYREGVVLKQLDGEALVEVGLEELVKVRASGLRPGERVVVRLERSGRELRSTLVSLDEVPHYFGFRVRLDRGGLRSLAKLKRGFFVLATSRLGRPLAGQVLDRLRGALASRPMLILFGSPKEGLYQMAEREGLKLEELADLVVNFIPNQGVETVRTEEALVSVLSIVNWLYWLEGEAR